MRKKLEQPLLFLGMETIGDLLGNQGGVAGGVVVDDKIDPVLVLHDLFTILGVWESSGKR